MNIKPKWEEYHPPMRVIVAPTRLVLAPTRLVVMDKAQPVQRAA